MQISLSREVVIVYLYLKKNQQLKDIYKDNLVFGAKTT